jgi:hypothetical protein
MRVPTPSPPLLVPGGLALSDSEKAEALADSLEAPFQPVNDPSPPAVIEVVNEAMRAYEYAPASEPKLTSPLEVLLLLLTAIGFLPGGSVQYTSTKKHKHYIRRRRRKIIKQTYNTITRNRKNKKQPYRTKNKHKTSNTNLQDNKITTYKTIR